MKTPLSLDLLEALDKVTREKPGMQPCEIRSAIGGIFRITARAAGWDFREEIWPTLREAVGKSVNLEEIPGESPDDRSAREVMAYIENLSPFCKG